MYLEVPVNSNVMMVHVDVERWMGPSALGLAGCVLPDVSVYSEQTFIQPTWTHEMQEGGENADVFFFFVVSTCHFLFYFDGCFGVLT